MLKPNPQLGGIEDAVYASVDPDSNKIISMLYRVKYFGSFVRKNRGWEYPTSKDASQLEDTMIVTIERSKANDLVSFFDDLPNDQSLDLKDFGDFISEDQTDVPAFRTR